MVGVKQKSLKKFPGAGRRENASILHAKIPYKFEISENGVYEELGLLLHT